jgi:hypothetical protein
MAIQEKILVPSERKTMVLESLANNIFVAHRPNDPTASQKETLTAIDQLVSF